MSAAPWYCRYGVHGELSRQTNVDGTAVYRTRELPCDCPMPPMPPPQPTPPPPRASLPSLSYSQKRSVVATPRRPSSSSCSFASSLPARRGSRRSLQSSGGRRSVCPLPLDNVWQPATHDGAAADGARSDAQLDFYASGLRVVVPPLTRSDAPQLGTPSTAGVDTVLPALPSIPVVWPQPAVPALDNVNVAARLHLTDEAVLAAVRQQRLSAVLPSPLLTATAETTAIAADEAAPTNPQEPQLERLTAVPSEVVSALPVAEAPPPVSTAPPCCCSAEQHSTLAQSGRLFCALCGLRLTPPTTDGATAVVYTADRCPAGPHTGQRASSLERFCVFCGTPFATEPPEQPTMQTAAPPVKEVQDDAEAGGKGAAIPTAPAAAPSFQPSVSMPVDGDALLTRRDMHTVDEIMTHLLGNAAAHGGRIHPPCGLPQCRLCELQTQARIPVRGAEAEEGGAGCGWWRSSAMCGAPAVAIIHNHYYR